MKFGQYLLDNKYPEWADQYLDYDALKKIIKSLEQVNGVLLIQTLFTKPLIHNWRDVFCSAGGLQLKGWIRQGLSHQEWTY